MAAAESAPGTRWLIGPRWDAVVCFGSVWFPALLYVLWRGCELLGVPPGEVTLAIVSVSLGATHFLSTFTFTYMDPDQRRFYRTRPMLYFGVPLLLIVAGWLHCALVGPTLLVTFWLLFGQHHVAAQNIGFLALYRQRNGEGDVDRRIDHLVFNSAWVTTVALYATRDPGGPAMEYFSRPTYAIPFADRGVLVGWLGAVAVAALLLFLGRQVQRWWTGRPVSVPKLVFMLTTWPSFLLVPFLTQDVAIVVMLRSAYHNVQYLGLVQLLNSRRCQARGAPAASGLLGRLMALGPLRYFGIHVGLAAAIWYLTDYLSLSSGWANDLGLRYLFYPGVPLAHFFLDGLTWRFSEAHARQSVLPYLRPTAPSAPGLEAQRVGA